MNEHTELPWKHCKLDGVWDTIESIDGQRIARLCNNNNANAEYIVRACNSHKKFLTACKRVRSWLNEERKEELTKAECEQILFTVIQKAST